MTGESFTADIFSLPVFDTHTHLNIPGVPITAQSVWDVVHYFWFLRELQAAGYPAQPDDLGVDERFQRLVPECAAF